MEEVLAAAEGFNFVEFVFDEPMGGFDVGLVGVSSRGDGVVLEAWDGFDDQVNRLGLRAFQAPINSAPLSVWNRQSLSWTRHERR